MLKRRRRQGYPLLRAVQTAGPSTWRLVAGAIVSVAIILVVVFVLVGRS